MTLEIEENPMGPVFEAEAVPSRIMTLEIGENFMGLVPMPDTPISGCVVGYQPVPEMDIPLNSISTPTPCAWQPDLHVATPFPTGM